MKIKLKDLAEELDISVAAVSMALNHKKGVSDETRDKVLELAISKGYKIKVPKVTEDIETETKEYIRLIRIQKHGLVASDTAFFTRIIEGIELECKKNGYELLITNSQLKDVDERWLQAQFEHHVVGLIVLATELEIEDVTMFDRVKQPFVMLDSYFPGKEWDFVLMNNHSAFYQGIEHLLAMGHKKIGYLKSSTGIYNFNERFRSYLDALHRFGLTYDSNYTFELEPTLNGAFRDMSQVLEAKGGIALPTAFMADNDLIAVGAVNAFKEEGYNVPQDVSVVGFDDMPITEVIQPNLTTSKVFKKEVGKEAVRVLVENIAQPRKASQKREVNTQLVIRSSVKKLKV